LGVPGLKVRREYDAHGYLVAVRDDATKAAFWQLDAVDGAGRIRSERFGNGVLSTRAYDAARSRTASISTWKGSTVLQNLGFTYDNRLNLKTRTDKLQAHTEYFQYDALDRLKCASLDDPNGCAEAYTYHPNGNLYTSSALGTYAYDPQHPHAATGTTVTGPDSYAYDAVGNQVMRPGLKVTYAAFDLPKTFERTATGETIALDYDGDQRRVRKATALEETVYVGDLYERVTDFANAEEEHRYYVHGPERMVAVVTQKIGAQPTTRYAHVDHLGSTDVLSNEVGTAVQQRSYGAFGARRNPKWGQPTPPAFSSETTRGFTSHEADEELGLVNMKGRIYDPQLGRFLTPDPIVAQPLSTQGWNPYSYTYNNPLAYIDPSGFASEDQAPAVDADYLEYINNPEVQRILAEGCLGLECTKRPREELPKEALQGAQETSMRWTPTDVGTYGNVASSTPQATAPEREQERTGWDRALLALDGAMEEYVGEVEDTAKSVMLGVATMGLYNIGPGAIGFYGAIWEGFEEDGVVGAINKFNPLTQIGILGAQISIAVEDDDYKAVGKAALKLGVMLAGIVAGGKASLGKGAGGAGSIRTGSYGSLRNTGVKDAHHIIQDAAVRELPGYSRSAAPAVELPGPSTQAGSPHYLATQAQRQPGGGTYAAERRIGYKALRKANFSPDLARSLIEQADNYFKSLGVGPGTPTRIPASRP